MPDEQTAKRADRANSYIPTSYEDLYNYYIGDPKDGNKLCRMLVRNALPYSSPEEKEVIVHDIFLRCMDNELLSIYDPTKANFGGAIFFVTRSVISNFLDRRTRDPIGGLKAGYLVEEPTEEFEPGQYALSNLFEVGTPNYEEHLDAKNLVDKLFSYAKYRFDKNECKRDQSLLPLLALLREQADAKECGKVLGVTPSTIYNWVAYLRDVGYRIKAGEPVQV